MRLLPRLFLPLILVLATACGTAPPAPANTAPSHTDASGVVEGQPDITANAAETPTHVDQSGFSDSAPLVQDSQSGPVRLYAPHIGPSASVWHPHLQIAKCTGEFVVCTVGDAYEVVDTEGNNVTTNGANQLWTALSTAGLAVPWNTTNTQLAVGDSSSAFAAAQTDMQAVAGTKLNAADVTSCTNATPIVCAGTYSPTPVAGQVVVISGMTGAGAAAVNQTFEMSVASASSITLLNSAGTGAITITGGLIKPINYYRQRANAAGSAVVSTNQIVYVATVGTANANYTWNEWGMSTGQQVTNVEAQPPPFLLNRAVVNLGTKTSASSWTATLTLSLS